ncbi:MAG TPA: plastocyanin/azurin family copper-binding protein [Acidimicrobiales bacterium]|nr:plastocyanin/azurin family copper-binding protein [Acidimicrobiales bacterium]
MASKLAPLALIATLAVAAAACGTPMAEDQGAADTDPIQPNHVVVKNISFIPNTITVKAGATVTWQWADGRTPHNVAFDGFASPIQTTGTWSHTFDTPGVYHYQCNLHSQMKATVVVQSS